MIQSDRLRIFGFVVAMSGVIPAFLGFTGLVDRSLLVLIFLPSILVGIVSAWFARRPAPRHDRWAFEREQAG